MPRISSQLGGPGWFLEFLKELFESSCYTWFIDFSLADGVERQIVLRVSSQVGGPGWFLEFLKELFESSCWTWFIYFFFADGVERQIVPRIISQVGHDWFLEYVKALF